MKTKDRLQNIAGIVIFLLALGFLIFKGCSA